MRVKTIAHGKTFNLGNYESRRIDMSAEMDEGEDEQIAMLRLKASVLGGGGDTQGAIALRQAVAAIEAEAADSMEPYRRTGLVRGAEG